MKCIKQRLLILCLCAFTSTAFAQTYEVLMKNRGTGGPMVYEPDFLAIQPGDSVKFVRKHKSHNAASIAELSPPGTPVLSAKSMRRLKSNTTPPVSTASNAHRTMRRA